MSTQEQALERWGWLCLSCRNTLQIAGDGLICMGCSQRYPVICGIPVLVAEPTAYLHAQFSSLAQAKLRAGQRLEQLKKPACSLNLPQISIDRHRDIAESELSQCDLLLSLLEPDLETFATAGKNGAPPRSSGWTFHALLPYLVRDWSGTPELTAAQSLIGDVLEDIFPCARSKSIAIAGCGAGGLLTAIPSSFEHVVGFDLTFPILRAATHLLGGKTLRVPWPRTLVGAGYISLRSEAGPASPPGMVAAMDALDTAFPDGALDCVVTSFLLDLLPEPRKLAAEIHRILAHDGVWINYGPSGPLQASWRFDNAECQAFFEMTGFNPIRAEAHRTTYLDLSRDFPSWSSQNHICYLTAARRSMAPKQAIARVPKAPVDVELVVPEHHAAAQLIKRQAMGDGSAPTFILRVERRPGKPERFAIAEEDLRILELVDGKSTVEEIANHFNAASPASTIAAFRRYFEQGLLVWRT